MTKRPADLPDILYHYCSIGGFDGIISKRNLWLSQLSTMSDYAEGKWFRKIMLEEFLRRKNAAQLPKVVSERLLHAIVAEGMAHGKFQTRLQNDGRDTRYCSCFSEAGDDLYQWRAYADDARGFAIGFDTDSIDEKNWYNGTDSRSFMTKVRYDETEHREAANRLIDTFFDTLVLVEADDKYTDEDVEAQLDEFFDNAVRPLSIIYKNGRFHHEREWRFVVETAHGTSRDYRERNPFYMSPTPATGSDFRLRGGEFVPHLIMPLGRIFSNPKHVREIWLGPRNPAATNRQGLDLYLGNKNIDPAIVRVSAATYR